MNVKLTLKEIANWQLKPDESEVYLPTIQRDFVWKPKQIEDLWDSILRGYPIGSFLMQKSGTKYDLLDGQQRATAIMLGFLNPYSVIEEKKEWSARIKKIIPTVWIDVDSTAEKPINSRFSVRVTTSPHPWGYRANDNNKVLSVADRREALKLFEKSILNKEKTFTQFDTTTTFPYDSSVPVPLSLIIESKSLDELIDKLQFVPENIETKQNRDLFKNREEYLSVLKNDKAYQLKSLFETVHSRIDGEKITQINYDLVKKEDLNEQDDETESKQDPTLFVRINSSGTPLNNDDLIYSIYKSIYPESKELIESIGASFAPAKLVISLVSRLVLTSINNYSYPDRMTVQRFQKQIVNDDFKKEFEDLVGTKDNSEFKQLFDLAINILRMADQSENRMPDFLVKQFVLREPDAFLFLMTWIRKYKKYNIKRIVGKLYTLQWFGFDNYRELWKHIDDEVFFDLSINSLSCLTLNKGIKAIISPVLLRSYFEEKFDDILKMSKNEWNYQFIPNDKIINNYRKNFPDLDDKKIQEEFHNLIIWLRDTRNKSLISFAQREYLNKTFKDYNSMETLEDSTIPWDWDHIYPASWVSNKRVKIFSIKYWTWSIGNYRALSLEQNRSENNKISPSARLENSEIRRDSFVYDNNDNFIDDYRYWSKLTRRDDDNEESASNHLHAILTRMINIYQKYWDDLEIEKLF